MFVSRWQAIFQVQWIRDGTTDDRRVFYIYQFSVHNYLTMTIYQTRLQQLEQRTIAFSVNVVKICGKHSHDSMLRPLLDQLIRSSTSIGANYAEANNASSKADFKNKIFIAKKEAAETRYWLQVLSELLPEEDLASLQQEALELTLIMQKIVSTMKNGE